ncbi:Uncharacterized protein Fot_01920 [Forsythia ovata]|uniref:Uncharacterized protein n=1 Tax=Forsythia ovata TaxID=205694 RepID=A0ABD1X5Z5_9LAMI
MEAQPYEIVVQKESEITGVDVGIEDAPMGPQVVESGAEIEYHILDGVVDANDDENGDNEGLNDSEYEQEKNVETNYLTSLFYSWNEKNFDIQQEEDPEYDSSDLDNNDTEDEDESNRFRNGPCFNERENMADPKFIATLFNFSNWRTVMALTTQDQD